jgi:putative PIN family toxin of toxin-antitoxin system
MAILQVVLDTNILVAGLRSQRGSSFRVLELVGRGDFDIHLSVPLVLEYQEVLYRQLPHLQISQSVVDDVIDFHCQVARQHAIYYLWRPFLPDPTDDMVLEVAVAGQCDCIVTYNVRDFVHVHDTFGIQIVTAREFLQMIEGVR